MIPNYSANTINGASRGTRITNKCLLICVLHPSNSLDHTSGIGTAHTEDTFIALFHCNQATSTIARYLTQSHFPYPELTSPCSISLMLNARKGRDKYKSYKSLVCFDCEPNFPSPERESRALLIQSPCPVYRLHII